MYVSRTLPLLRAIVPRWKSNTAAPRNLEAVDTFTNDHGLMGDSDPETGSSNALGWRISHFSSTFGRRELEQAGGRSLQSTTPSNDVSIPLDWVSSWSHGAGLIITPQKFFPVSHFMHMHGIILLHTHTPNTL